MARGRMRRLQRNFPTRSVVTVNHSGVARLCRRWRGREKRNEYAETGDASTAKSELSKKVFRENRVTSATARFLEIRGRKLDGVRGKGVPGRVAKVVRERAAHNLARARVSPPHSRSFLFQLPSSSSPPSRPSHPRKCRVPKSRFAVIDLRFCVTVPLPDFFPVKSHRFNCHRKRDTRERASGG